MARSSAALRPRLELSPTRLDIAIEVLSAVVLLMLIALPLVYWNDLPDRIPTHYDFSGRIDAWGSRWTVLLLPVVALVIYVPLTILPRYPHRFNYAWTITAENAEWQYRLAATFMRLIKLQALLLFLWIAWGTVWCALGRLAALPPAGLLVDVAMIFVTLVVYLIWALRAR